MSQLRFIRRILVLLIGGSMTFIGAIMLPLPWPFGFGIILVPAGLMIMASEYPFARRWLDWIKRRTGPLGKAIQAVESRAASLSDRMLRRRGSRRAHPPTD